MTTLAHSTLFSQAHSWLAQDPDPDTRAELQQLLEQAQAGDTEALSILQQRFSGRLTFGTAGLRARQQAGPMGMNRVVVAQTAVGFGHYLLKREPTPSIVIGYDARNNSKCYAQDSAELMSAMGIKVSLLPRPLPTPVLAFAVRELNTSAGIMVTASHNPPQDNGYKVYLGGEDGGAQIVSPADKAIANEIAQVADQQRIDTLPRSHDYQQVDESVIKQYIARTASLCQQQKQSALPYVYTALHGVGYETLCQVLAQAQLPLPIAVDAQCQPDGAFPSVRYPNPEEDGALDMAIATADAHGARYILANDPDADRLAVAIKQDDGSWHNLHGNIIGCLLGWHIAQQAQAQGKHGTLACSLVSSPALAAIAKHCGLDFCETLTGFKWIGRTPKLLFGYEEALGYLVDPDKVHDKDGISAAVVMLDILLRLQALGQTLADYHQAFLQTFGAYASAQVSSRFEHYQPLERLMQSLREQPPQRIGDSAVKQFIDHQYTDKQSNILVFHLDNQTRIIIRPSGTEPKLKCYIDVKTANVAQSNARIDALQPALQALIAQHTTTPPNQHGQIN